MAPKRTLSLDMLIRKMPYGPRATICRMMDISNWKELAGAITDPKTNDCRYSIDEIANFELELRKNNSMTEAVLRDWGTQETTVGQLLEILMEIGRKDVIHEVMPEFLNQNNPNSEFVGHYREPPVHMNIGGNSASSIEENMTGMKIGDTKSTVEQDPATTAVAKSSDTEQIMQNASAEGVKELSFYALRAIAKNFDPKSKLGEGGFGTVYLGRNSKYGDIAIKVLKEKEETHKDQFKNELKHLSSLSHKNILPPIYYSFDGPSFCLVYRFMPNGSLEDCLRKSSTRCLSWRRRLSIATDIALGISFLHSEQIVHRDIKSANVLLDENFVGKVADFGLVRNIGKDNKTYVTKMIIGSPVYMCREAFHGDVSPTVDVYSYGVILLELITGLPTTDIPTTEEDIVTYCQNRVESSRDELYSMVDNYMEDVIFEEVDGLYTLADSCLEERKVKRISMEKLLCEIKKMSKVEE